MFKNPLQVVFWNGKATYYTGSLFGRLILGDDWVFTGVAGFWATAISFKVIMTLTMLGRKPWGLICWCSVAGFSTPKCWGQPCLSHLGNWLKHQPFFKSNIDYGVLCRQFENCRQLKFMVLVVVPCTIIKFSSSTTTQSDTVSSSIDNYERCYGANIFSRWPTRKLRRWTLHDTIRLERAMEEKQRVMSCWEAP